MSNKSDTVYEYKKVKPIEKGEDWNPNPSTLLQVTENTRTFKNKINELCIEQNHLMKDFELYKKAFIQSLRDTMDLLKPMRLMNEKILDLERRIK